MTKYCRWFCTEYIDNNKWLYESRCGGKMEVSKNSKFFKYLHMDNDLNLCPNCERPIIVAQLMD